jgi:hypothetical protein
MSDDLDLRAVHQHHELDPEFRAALRQRVMQLLSGDGSPVPDTDDSVLDRIELAPRRSSHRRRWPTLIVAAAATAVAVIAVVTIRSDESTVSTSEHDAT